MALTVEWKHRIERWQKALWNACYRPLGSITLSGFTTNRTADRRTGMAQTFQPMPEGTPWGAKWEYGWFKGSVTLPASGSRKTHCPPPDPGRGKPGLDQRESRRFNRLGA